MVTDDTQISKAEKINLLKESLNALALAQDAYNTDDNKPPTGWKVIACTTTPQPTVKGFFARVYERMGPVLPGECKYTISFRGTNAFTDIKDVDADLGIAFRELPNQYRQGLDFLERVCREKNIDPKEMMFAGHSLGGYLAITVGTALGVNKIWAFNSPGPTEKIRDEIEQQIPGISQPPGDNLIQVRSIYDLISKWQYNQGIILGVKTGGDNHSLKSLQQGIVAAISGLPVKLVKASNKFSALFNGFARFLAQSRIAGAIINRFEDNDRHHQPSRYKKFIK